MMKHILIAGLAATTFAAGSASAAEIKITDVDGIWTATDPGATAVSGVNTNVIQWGDPATNNGPSGYEFFGASTPFDVDEEVNFDLGTFTHFNFPVFEPTLNTARLEVTSTIDVDNTERTIASIFDFTHLETTNTLDPCPDGDANGDGANVNGCADRVSFEFNAGASDSLTVGGVEYFVEIAGFFYNGELANEFWTEEETENEAILKGVVSSRQVEVPEPSTLALLGLGLLGLGFRKKLSKAA